VTEHAPAGIPRQPESASLAGWHRLHPLSPFVRAGRQMMSLVIVLVGIAVLNQHQSAGDLTTDLVIIGLALAGGFISWLVTRWQLTDDVLRVESGLIRRSSQRLPLAQIQAVDVVQSGLARALGLAELQLRMAGGGATGGRLACLRLSDAEELRRKLLALAAPLAPPATAANGTAGLTGAVQLAPATGTLPEAAAVTLPAQSQSQPRPAAAAERLLFRVNSARLPAAVLLSRAGAVALVAGVATWLTVWLSGSVSTITPYLPVILGVVVALWRQFNGEFGTTVSAAPDGLRLRSGMIQTAAETIRPGRIQAVRLVEPLIWRAFGWCRLEVDVAGGRQKHEDRSEGRRLRALIPVGSTADAEAMIGALLGSSPVASERPPAIVRWKAPLSYHFLAWNGDDRYAVASRGRVRRETTWVPMEKVQSIRWVQGPLQRRLGLASVNLDVAGKRVTLSIRDRSASEAGEILSRLPDLARAARQVAR
jgi:putative membrane protein